MQLCNYVICNYAIMQLCNYVIMKLCNYAIMQSCHHVIMHLCTKLCNDALLLPYLARFSEYSRWHALKNYAFTIAFTIRIGIQKYLSLAWRK